MRTLLALLSIFSSITLSGQAGRGLDPSDHLPEGYTLFDKISGDLNGDGLEDCVLMIKATEKDLIVSDDRGGVLDRNRRGIIVLFNKNGRYDLAVKNDDCFSSENEDGGVYFAPELSIAIEAGKLIIHYGHGRYGYWKYSFRFQNGDMELIGYDAAEHHGPIVNTITSVNFLTEKKLLKKNINKDSAEGNEIFVDSWEEIRLKKLIKLSQVEDFDTFEVDLLPK